MLHSNIGIQSRNNKPSDMKKQLVLCIVLLNLVHFLEACSDPSVSISFMLRFRQMEAMKDEIEQIDILLTEIETTALTRDNIEDMNKRKAEVRQRIKKVKNEQEDIEQCIEKSKEKIKPEVAKKLGEQNMELNVVKIIVAISLLLSGLSVAITIKHRNNSRVSNVTVTIQESSRVMQNH